MGYAIVNRTSLGGTTGQRNQPAQKSSADILDNPTNIDFENVPGRLADHYDPRTHTVRLSQDVATKRSVAAMAIVAHELGHAQQHENHSFLINMRNVLVPAVQLSPRISYLLLIIGLIFNLTGLFWLGILFFCLTVLFALLTLPVEIDASKRGRQLLCDAELMTTDQDEKGTRQVLMAAAGTYLAAAVSAILQLFYFIRLGRRAA